MEVRVQPRSEGNQNCLDFQLHTNPRTQILSYRGEFGNRVHHFDIPNSHNHLTIIAESLVSITTPPPVPDALDEGVWEKLDTLTANDEYWDTLMPSRFTNPTDLLDVLAQELDVRRRAEPLTTLRALNGALYRTFDYALKTTQVDSSIDEALRLRKGVCQDFAHIMITLVRSYLHVPCRYVSGYLLSQESGQARSSSDAMHAWVEAYLPDLGWVGFDPTNDTLPDERHVRVAVGRDYADVTPVHGIFRGKAESELAVSIRFAPSQVKLSDDLPPESAWMSSSQEEDYNQVQHQLQPEQQQQQQQP
jgi:transglutaminase-like putative cysteine protease